MISALAGTCALVWNYRDAEEVLTINPLLGGRVHTHTWLGRNRTTPVLAFTGDNRRIDLYVTTTQSFAGILPQEHDNYQIGTITTLRATKALKSLQLLAGCTDGMVHLWNMKDQDYKRGFTEHRGSSIVGLATSPNGYFSTASDDGKLLLHIPNQTAGNEYAYQTSLLCSADHVPKLGLEFSDVEPTLLGGVHANNIQLWDMTRPQVPQVIRTPTTVRGIAFSPTDANAFYSCSGQTVTIWDRRSQQPAGSLSVGQSISSLALREDARYIAVGTGGGSIMMYDMKTLSMTHGPLKSGNSCPITEVQFYTPNAKSAKKASIGKPSSVSSAAPGRSSSSSGGQQRTSASGAPPVPATASRVPQAPGVGTMPSGIPSRAAAPTPPATTANGTAAGLSSWMNQTALNNGLSGQSLSSMMSPAPTLAVAPMDITPVDKTVPSGGAGTSFLTPINTNLELSLADTAITPGPAPPSKFSFGSDALPTGALKEATNYIPGATAAPRPGATSLHDKKLANSMGASAAPAPAVAVASSIPSRPASTIPTSGLPSATQAAATRPLATHSSPGIPGHLGEGRQPALNYAPPPAATTSDPSAPRFIPNIIPPGGYVGAAEAAGQDEDVHNAEHPVSPSAHQGGAASRAAQPLTESVFQSYVDRAIDGVQEQVRNLHIEVLRQAHMQETVVTEQNRQLAQGLANVMQRQDQLAAALETITQLLQRNNLGWL